MFSNEQTSDLEKTLASCRGVVAIDACLSVRTRRLLADFATRGGRVLTFGAASVGPGYEPVSFPATYPVVEQREALSQIGGQNSPAPIACQVSSYHPILRGLTSIRLLRPGLAQPRGSARVFASTAAGSPVIAAGDRMVYVAGFPTELNEQEAPLENFSRWCGVEPSGIVVSRFENATVVQNWDTHNHRIECSVIDPKPWIGSVRIAGPQAGQTWELREDHPWLAYHEQNGNTVLEAVRLDPKGVKGVSEGTGAGAATLRELAGHSGIQFLVGRRVASYHRAISQSPAQRKWRVVSSLVLGSINEVAWYVAERGVARVAEGQGRDVRFCVEPS